MYLLAERHALIQGRLEEDGRVLADNLAGEFLVSEDTIRRDLRLLAAKGVCRRVYGGAVAITSADSPLGQRQNEDRERKAALAIAARSIPEPGSLVFIDAGSTNQALARALPRDRRLTVATNSPAVAAALLDLPVFMVGGQLDQHTGACLGASALESLSNLRPDVSFIGVCGIDSTGGTSAFSAEDAAFKRRLVAQSSSVAVMATNEKLGSPAPFGIAGRESVSFLVVEHDCPDHQLEGFGEARAHVVRAGKP